MSTERRRWITLAEVLAVAGVVIAALTLWNSWSERRTAAAEKAAEITGEARARSRLDLAGTPGAGGGRLTLASGEHELSEVTVAFPAALGVTPKRPATPGIDAA